MSLLVSHRLAMPTRALLALLAHAQASASDTERYTLFHAPVTLLRNAQLFDSTGSVPREHMSVLIRDGRTAEVGRIAPGLLADLIAFAAPLDAAKPALPDVAWTMKAGRAWDRAKILNALKGQVGLR